MGFGKQGIWEECPWLAAEQSADRAANRTDRTADTVRTVGTARIPMMVLIIGFAGLPRSVNFFQQCGMLRVIKEAGFGIPAISLPARDGGPGRFLELSADPGVKPERG